jgi:cytosine permease
MSKADTLKKVQNEETTGYAITRVPGAKRISTYSLSTTWMGWIFYMGGPYMGALIAASMSPSAALSAIIAGNVLLFVIAYLNGDIGAKMGLSVSMCSRFSFGNIGTVIPSLVYWITLAGWFGVSIGLLAAVLESNIGGTAWLWSVIMGVIMTIMAVYGMKVISRFAFYVAPAILILMVVGFVLALGKIPAGQSLFPEGPFGGKSWLLAFGLTVSHWVVGASLAPDVMRFARSKKSVVWASFWGFVVANNLIMLLGVLTSWTLNTMDFFVVMPTLAGDFWKVLSLLVILGVVLTSGDCQCYTSGLALSNLTKWDSRVTTGIAGVMGVILAVSGIYGQAINWLLFLGIFVPGVPAVMIVDYYYHHNQKYPSVENVRLGANWNAIIAYGIGAVVEHFMTNVWGVGVFALNAFVVTAVLYIILTSINKVRVFDPSAPSASGYYLTPEEQREMGLIS